MLSGLDGGIASLRDLRTVLLAQYGLVMEQLRRVGEVRSVHTLSIAFLLDFEALLGTPPSLVFSSLLVDTCGFDRCLLLSRH